MESLKWKYLIRVMSFERECKYTNEGAILKQLCPGMDEDGEYGWELVSTIPIKNEVKDGNQSIEFLFIYKRPIGWQDEE